MLSMHLALWLMLLELVADCEAQRWFPRPPGFPFLHVFQNKNAYSEGRLLIAHAREAGSTISLSVLPTFPQVKLRTLKLDVDVRELSVSNSLTFSRGKVRIGVF